MRLTRSRQRSSGHSAVAVLTLGPAGKAGPGLALFPPPPGDDLVEAAGGPRPAIVRGALEGRAGCKAFDQMAGELKA